MYIGIHPCVAVLICVQKLYIVLYGANVCYSGILRGFVQFNVIRRQSRLHHCNFSFIWTEVLFLALAWNGDKPAEWVIKYSDCTVERAIVG